MLVVQWWRIGLVQGHLGESWKEKVIYVGNQGTPSCLSQATIGCVIFVNTQGADDRLNREGNKTGSPGFASENVAIIDGSCEVWLKSMCSWDLFLPYSPLLGQVLNLMNIFYLEMFPDDKLIELVQVYHWSLRVIFFGDQEHSGQEPLCVWWVHYYNCSLFYEFKDLGVN